MLMLRFLYALFFGCFHKRTTFPMTLNRTGVNGDVGRCTYVSCLVCGEELAYNWDKMRVEGRLPRESPIQTPAPALLPVPPMAVTPTGVRIYGGLLPMESAMQRAGARSTTSIRWQSEAER